MGNASQKATDFATENFTAAATKITDTANVATSGILFGVTGQKVGQAGQEPDEVPTVPESAQSLGADELHEEGKGLLEQQQPRLAGQYFALSCEKGHGKSCLLAAEIWRVGVARSHIVSS